MSGSAEPKQATTGVVGVVTLLATILVAVLVLTLRVLVEPASGNSDTTPTAHMLTPVPAPTCAGRTTTGPRELRGMWLTTINNSDWPSRPGLPEETVKAEFRAWLDLAQRLNHNAIFVHVRPSGDAFWPSDYVLWSEFLTGQAGQSPGWDPMAFMIAETHARNMEFHAWFNPYKAGQAARVEDLPPNHPLRAHPDWAVTYPQNSPNSARVYYNPGIPAARQFVEDSILEPVRKYDLDGVHFDDFFYPYPAPKKDFLDAAAYAQFGNGVEKADWRRQNVNTFVRDMHERIKAIKPWVKFGISPFGIWRNASTDRLGSDTKGLQSYDAIYADTRAWVKNGWLDYIAPQLYWHIGFDKADYAKLLPWWTETVKGTGVQLYVGQADYRVGEKGPWSDPAQLDRQLALNRGARVSGSIHFSARHLRKDPLGAVSRYVRSQNATPALVPAMSRLPGFRPEAPIVSTVRREAAGPVTLTWTADGRSTATRHAIYRVDPATQEPPVLVGTTTGGKGKHTWVDQSARPGPAYAYCVSGLDRLWNEGPASLAQIVVG